MKKYLLILILLSINLKTFSQTDSLRLNSIENTLKSYGKQNVITDKITLGSIILVVVGSACNMKPTPMLLSTSLLSLLNLSISYKADLKLSKDKKVIETKF